jgi:arsenate reductase
MGDKLKQVLFVCVHNSGRSQMAEAIFNHFAKGKAKAVSAGTQPGAEVNPLALQALSEIGVPTDGLHPKLLTREMIQQAHRVITMGCGVEESCPALLHGISEDWGLEDPSGQPIEKVREIRDQIVVLVRKLLQELEAA